MKNDLILIATVAAGLFAAPAAADDWPQFRGPDRVSISKEKRLLRSWPAEGPKLLWQVKDVGYRIKNDAIEQFSHVTPSLNVRRCLLIVTNK